MFTPFIAAAAIALLLIGLSFYSALKESAALSRWSMDFAAKQAGIETVVLAGSLGDLAAEIADMIARLERDLERVRERRAEAELISKHEVEFLKSVSHELRTPLNAILGFADVLSQEIDGPLTDGQKESVQTIWNSGQYLKSLVEEVLEMAALKTGNLELNVQDDVDAVAIVDEVSKMLQGQVGQKPVEIKTRIEKGFPPIPVDPKRLRQILVNLGSNAVNVTDKGSVTLVAELLGDDAMFSVEDTGPGIPPEKQQSIFQDFEQLDHSGKPLSGTGLGLAICRQLATLMGGQVLVESGEGLGSTFFLQLPLPNRSNADTAQADSDEGVVAEPEESPPEALDLDAPLDPELDP